VLKCKLQSKGDIQSLQSQVNTLLQENNHYQYLNQKAKQNKEIKIQELQATINILSHKSDYHMQIFNLSKDLENEKLLNSHLHMDIHQYNRIIEDKSKSIHSLEYNMNALQNMVDSVDLVKTIMNIPGVHVFSAITIFSQEINTSKAVINKHSNTIHELQQHIKVLQKQLQQSLQSVANASNNANPATVASAASTAATGKSRQRSLSPYRNNNIIDNLPSGGAFNPSLYSTTAATGNLNATDSDSLDNNTAGDSNQVFARINKIIIDEDSSIGSLLQSVDKAVLINQIASQQSKIHDLQLQIQSLPSSATLAAAAGGGGGVDGGQDYEIILKADRKEYDNLHSKLHIADQRIEDLINEKNHLLEANIQLEKEVIALKINGSSNSASTKAELDELGPDYVSDITSNEINGYKQTIQQKNAEIKILNETLEALHLHHQQTNENSNLSNLTNDMNQALHIGTAQSNKPDFYEHSTHYTLYAYIKRIIELTTELSTLSSKQTISQQHHNELEAKYSKLSKKYNHLSVHLNTADSDKLKLVEEINSLKKQLISYEHHHLDDYNELKHENHKLTNLLADAEYKMNHYVLQVHDLQLQIQNATNTQMEIIIQDIKQDIHLHTMKSHDQMSPSSPSVSYPTTPDGVKNDDESGLRHMIAELLIKWKEHHGIIPTTSNIFQHHQHQQYSNSPPSTKLSKAEIKYLQKISNLLLSAHHKVVSYEQQIQQVTRQNQSLQHEKQLINDKLQLCIQQLVEYKQRCGLYNQVITTEQHHPIVKQGKLVSVLKKHIHRLEEQAMKSHQEKTKLQKSHSQQLVATMQNDHHLRQLRAKLLFLESKGSNLIQAKEYVYDHMHSYMHTIYANIQSWFQRELPVLMNNLPISDLITSLSTHLLDGNYMNKYLGDTVPAPASAPPPVPLLDKSYVLSQTICEYKANISYLEMQLYQAQQQYHVMKDKNTILENVIYKYKHQQQQESQPSTLLHSAGTGSGASTDAIGSRDGLVSIDEANQLVSLYLDKENIYAHRIHNLQHDHLLLEEQNIEYKHKLEMYTKQLDNYKKLIQQYTHTENHIKQVNMNQVTKLRIELENEYMNNMKQLREYYEKERSAYLHELQQVTQAVQDVNHPEAGDSAQLPIHIHWPSHHQDDPNASSTSLHEDAHEKRSIRFSTNPIQRDDDLMGSYGHDIPEQSSSAPSIRLSMTSQPSLSESHEREVKPARGNGDGSERSSDRSDQQRHGNEASIVRYYKENINKLEDDTATASPFRQPADHIPTNSSSMKDSGDCAATTAIPPTSLVERIQAKLLKLHEKSDELDGVLYDNQDLHQHIDNIHNISSGSSQPSSGSVMQYHIHVEKLLRMIDLEKRKTVEAKLEVIYCTVCSGMR
jgi:hypothetical protein